MNINFPENQSCNNIFEAFVKAWVNFCNYKGRASRYDYWSFIFVNFLINFAFMLVGFFAISISEQASNGVDISSTVYSVAFLVPWIAAIVRRLHDTGRSALKWLLAFPLLGFFLVFILGILAGFKFDAKNVSIILTAFFICGYMLTLLVLLCLRGSEKDNKYGPAVAEDAGQRWKGLAMPIFMIIMPILAAFAMGVVSGYSKAMNRYKTEKEIAPAIYDVLSKAKGQDGSDAIANFDPQASNAQPVGVLTTTPSGNKVEIKRSGDFFEVTVDNVSGELCVALFGYNWYEHPDFMTMGINEGENCQICLSTPCTITWRYK